MNSRLSMIPHLGKKAEELAKTLWHLGNQVFQCPDDAKQALKPILKSLKYHQVHYDIHPVERYTGKGRPKPGIRNRSGSSLLIRGLSR